jgi:hypothetical protein
MINIKESNCRYVRSHFSECTLHKFSRKIHKGFAFNDRKEMGRLVYILLCAQKYKVGRHSAHYGIVIYDSFATLMFASLNSDSLIGFCIFPAHRAEKLASKDPPQKQMGVYSSDKL